MATATALAFGWTRWFRCESSFELPLVPKTPGLIAVGRKDESGRELKVVRLEATEDLFHTLNQFFNAGSAWRKELETGHCLLRYVCIPDSNRRHALFSALQTWVEDPSQNRSAVVEDFLRAPDPYLFGRE